MGAGQSGGSSVVSHKGQETEGCQKISVENWWWRVRAKCWVLTHRKAITMSKSNGREQSSKASDDIGLTWSIQNHLQNWHRHLWEIAHSPSKLHFHWHCPSQIAQGVLAICWHNKGRVSKVMGWIMVPAKECTRTQLPWGASLDQNCCQALLIIVWNGTIARNIQSAGPCHPQAWLWHDVTCHWPLQ